MARRSRILRRCSRWGVAWAIFWVASVTCAATPQQSDSGSFGRLGLGARSAALGGGIAAIDEDASAVQSNPAGLARLGAPATAALEAGIPGGGGYLFYGGAAGWVMPEFSVGFTALYFNEGPVELRSSNTLTPDAVGGASASAITIAGAGRLLPPVDLGVSFRYITETVSDPAVSTPILAGSGISADAGLVYRPWSRITLAAVALDIFPSGIDWSTNGRGDFFRRTYRLGAAVDLNPVMVVGQVDDVSGGYRRVRGGAEWDVHPLMTLRAGLDGSHPAGGFGIHAPWHKEFLVRFDYAFAVTPLGGTEFQHRATFSVDWMVPDWPTGRLVFPSEEPSPRGTPETPRRPPPLFNWPAN